MNRFFVLVAIALILGSVENAQAREETGFVTDGRKAAPVARKYEGETPDISIANARNATVVVYSHGTRRPKNRENCKKQGKQPPNAIMALEDDPDTYVFFLCSSAVDGNVKGSYIQKRKKEIQSVLAELVSIGVQPRNIFLSGHSAGAWSSLMSMDVVGETFNAAILFAPACCGPRSEKNKYPIWRKEIRPAQVKQIVSVPRIEALVFAFERDKFNRTRELTFLTEAFPNTVKIVTSSCGKHDDHHKNCSGMKLTTMIREYIEARKAGF